MASSFINDSLKIMRLPGQVEDPVVDMGQISLSQEIGNRKFLKYFDRKFTKHLGSWPDTFDKVTKSKYKC